MNARANRREFITLLGSAAAPSLPWPQLTRAPARNP